MSTMRPLLASVLIGSLFGAALLISCISSPSVIIAQFALTDNHMLRTYINASMCTALLITLSNRWCVSIGPRSAAGTLSSRWPNRYQANVVGGMVQGIGMAISGACPGTVLVQVALGVGKGKTVLVGGVLGGLAYVLVGEKIRSPLGGGGEKKTVQQCLSVSSSMALLLYELILLVVLSLVSFESAAGSGSPSRIVHPVWGGCLIGLVQACSLAVSRKLLGVSTAYQNVAEYIVLVFRRLVSSTGKPQLGPGWSSILFALGVMGGARIVAASQRVAYIVDGDGAHVTTLAALMGGFLGIFGARLAGGCTSGHGISGISTLSVSSFVTVASMLGGGILWKAIVG